MNPLINTEPNLKDMLDGQLNAIIQDANNALFHLRTGNSLEQAIEKAESCALRQQHLSKLVDQLKIEEMKNIIKQREGVEL